MNIRVKGLHRTVLLDTGQTTPTKKFIRKIILLQTLLVKRAKTLKYLIHFMFAINVFKLLEILFICQEKASYSITTN